MSPIVSSDRRRPRLGLALALGLGAAVAVVAATLALAPPDEWTAYLAARPIDCSPAENPAAAWVLHATHRDGGLEHLSYTVGIHPPGSIAPTVAVRAFDGWLLGRDHGEFGGELVYRDGNGTDRMLADINIRGIQPIPDGFQVVAGRGFMDSMNGVGSIITVTEQGDTVHTTSVELPGAPTRWHRLASGALLVRTLEKNVLVPVGGEAREVKCRPAQSDGN